MNGNIQRGCDAEFDLSPFDFKDFNFYFVVDNYSLSGIPG